MMMRGRMRGISTLKKLRGNWLNGLKKKGLRGTLEELSRDSFINLETIKIILST
jgi:hypothetical protein